MEADLGWKEKGCPPRFTRGNELDTQTTDELHDWSESCLQGSHPTWKTWNFVIYFSRSGKCLEFSQKVQKTWNLTQNLEKSWI